MDETALDDKKALWRLRASAQETRRVIKRAQQALAEAIESLELASKLDTPLLRTKR